MQRLARYLPPLFSLLLLSGCVGQFHSGGTYPESKVMRPEVIEAPQPAVTPHTEQPPATVYSRPAAVSSLITRAQQQRLAGDAETALATLERALRISPRDGGIYYEMALTHQALQQPSQAQQLARRGLSLTQDPQTRQALESLLTQL